MEMLSAALKCPIIQINSETTIVGKVVLSNNDWIKASQQLNGVAFKIYLFFASQVDGSAYELEKEQLAFALGFAPQTLYKGITELQLAGFLCQKEKNLYVFDTVSAFEAS